jgi:hypothetical protein
VSTLRARWKLVALAIAALAAAAVILSLTAFNSSESGNSNAAASDAEQAMLDFAQCMRDNGVPSFPDPVARPDGRFGFQRPQGIPQSALDNGLESCQSELQATGLSIGPAAQDDTAVQDGLLAFSRCMRENGVPDFPDPKPNSDLLSGLHGLFSNIDQGSPGVQQAIQSCQSILNQLFGPGHGGGG